MAMRLRTRFTAPFVVASLALTFPDLCAAKPAIDASRIEAHVRFLADDAQEGRGLGTPGHERSAQYVATELQRMGWDPAGDDGYFQWMPLRRSLVRAAETSLRIVQKDKTHELKLGIDYVVGRIGRETEIDLTAPIRLAGHGVSAPELGHDDYKKVDTRGAAVFLLNQAPSSMTLAARQYYGSSAIKEKTALQHGARAWLHVGGWANTDAAHPPRLQWVERQGGPSPGIPEIRLSQSAATLISAKPSTLQFHLRADNTLFRSPNVVAVLPGSDPKLRREYVVFSAHLDHLGRDLSLAGDNIFNGALDNASGVAALLEVARAFVEAPKRARRSILLLITTGEESGLLGVDYFVHHPPVPLSSIVADINLDSFLALYPVQDVVAFGAEYSTLDAPVKKAATGIGLVLSPDPLPDQMLFVRSDHYSFVQRGIPALFLFAGFTGAPLRGGVPLPLHWLSTIYHTPADDVSQNIHYESIARMAELNFRLGEAVAREGKRPQWKRGSFFARRFGRR